MKEITRKHYDELAYKGQVPGVPKKLKVNPNPKPVPAPIPKAEPEVHNHVHKSENHNHIDLTPLQRGQDDIREVIQKNSLLIKQLGAELKAAKKNNKQSVEFTVKRDDKGLIESITADYN